MVFSCFTFRFRILALLALPLYAFGQIPPPAIEIKGFCIKIPESDTLPRFIDFVKKDLASHGINTLILRVDYHYRYQSHPELANEKALTHDQVKQLVVACRESGIRIIPQINLLGHQSWSNQLEKLLQVYPQFDETPHVAMPEKYEWPNDDGLYCKSYCPLHPEVHEVVFSLVDEIMEVFEANAFHAGLDEVFYIGDDRCPRCAGKDKSDLFAGEVSKIRDHLAQKGHELWMWGDRLLDGESTGLGIWEASGNDTHQAIDKIPRDVVICDWHYERPEPTAAYFAMKGFRVVTCPWNKPEVTLAQYEDMIRFKQNANPTLARRYAGMMQTTWSSAESFLNTYYGNDDGESGKRGPVDSLNILLKKFKDE